MEQRRQAQASAVSQFGSHLWWWNRWSQSSWLVFWVSTAWLSQSSSVRKVRNTFILVKKGDSYNYRFGYSHMASGLVCGFSCVVNMFAYLGCWVRNRNCGRCGNTGKCAAIKVICRFNFDPDFWRGFGFVWTNRITHSNFMIVPSYIFLIFNSQ